jgi:hypothetical protein
MLIIDIIQLKAYQPVPYENTHTCIYSEILCERAPKQRNRMLHPSSQAGITAALSRKQSAQNNKFPMFCMIVKHCLLLPGKGIRIYCKCSKTKCTGKYLDRKRTK